MRSIQKTRKRTIIITLSIVLTVIIVGVAASITLLNQNQYPDDTNRAAPAFQSLLPRNTSIEELGGWQKGTPPNGTDPYYVFVDTVENVKIRVSQQVLPKTFKDDTAKHIAQLAESDNATRSLQIGDTRVYIGISAQGPQSLYFTKNGLLILIKSEATLSDEVWTTYIASLRTS